MNTVQVKVSQRVVTEALAIKPDYDSNAAHLSRLLEIGIDAVNKLGKPTAGTAEVLPSKAVNKEKDVEISLRAEEAHIPAAALKKVKDPYAAKKLSPELVADDLSEFADLLVDWWAVRKGTRSGRSWAYAMGKLRSIPYEDRRRALEDAYNSGWASIYPPKADTPQQGKWKEPEMKHPAYRDASEVIAERDRLAQQNVEHLRQQRQEREEAEAGKGVLEMFG